MPTTTVNALPRGTNFSRYLKALILAEGNPWEARQISEAWRDTPAVHLSFRDAPALALSFRSGVNALDTQDTSALASYGITAEFLELLSVVSVVERLKARMWRVPFRVKAPFESVAPTGDWVQEGKPVPAISPTLSSATLDLTKIGAIGVVSQELAKVSSPSAEAVLRRIVVNGVGYVMDNKFLNPAITALSEVRPASITNGATLRTSTGSTAATIQADLGAMAASLTTFRDVVWIMRPATLLYLASLDAQFLKYNGAVPMLLGKPVYESQGSPQQITLVDVGSVALADEGQMDISASTVASLELDTAPASGDQSPLSDLTNLKSLFQNDLIAIKVIRQISWVLAYSTSAAYMPVAY